MRLGLLLLAAVACVSAAPLGQPSASDAGAVEARSGSGTDKAFEDMTRKERLEWLARTGGSREEALREKNSEADLRASEAADENGFIAKLKGALKGKKESSREGNSS